MTTAVNHDPSRCLSKSKCGKCVPACPWKAIVFCGDHAVSIEFKKCMGPCFDEFGKHGKHRPCQTACSTALSNAQSKGKLALHTEVR